MVKVSLAVLASFGLGAMCPALAQSDPMAAGRQAAANQLGVMEFCQAQGFADGDAVTAQRAAFGRLPPPPAGSPPTDAAEALGRQGTLSMNGTQTTLTDLASTHGTTVAAMCGQMASVAKQVAGQMQGMPSMPGGMPLMPSGMPSMPSMPGGMPAMPNMPGMPGAPSATPR